jgi:uncharacterized protein (UPF0303 family)
MRTTFEHKYKIGEKVFHVTPESPQGIIIDITFSSLRPPLYKVAWSAVDTSWCEEIELTDHKNF